MVRDERMTTFEPIFEELKAISDLLEKSVSESPEQPEQWIELLDQRQAIIDQITEHVSNGLILSDEWKNRYLLPIHQSDQRLIKAIEENKRVFYEKLKTIRKTKKANQQYYGLGQINPYGAFFDKKK